MSSVFCPYPITASTSPVATLSVAFTITVTVPSHGAATGVSIFITSMTRISSPFETDCPLCAVTRSTVRTARSAR